SPVRQPAGAGAGARPLAPGLGPDARARRAWWASQAAPGGAPRPGRSDVRAGLRRSHDPGRTRARGDRPVPRRARLAARRDREEPRHQPDHSLAAAPGLRSAPRRPEQMGAGLLVLAALATPLAAQSPDTSTFSSPAARELFARAAARHH